MFSLVYLAVPFNRWGECEEQDDLVLGSEEEEEEDVKKAMHFPNTIVLLKLFLCLSLK